MHTVASPINLTTVLHPIWQPDSGKLGSTDGSPTGRSSSDLALLNLID